MLLATCAVSYTCKWCVQAREREQREVLTEPIPTKEEWSDSTSHKIINYHNYRFFCGSVNNIPTRQQILTTDVTIAGAYGYLKIINKHVTPWQNASEELDPKEPQNVRSLFGEGFFSRSSSILQPELDPKEP